MNWKNSIAQRKTLPTRLCTTRSSRHTSAWSGRGAEISTQGTIWASICPTTPTLKSTGVSASALCSTCCSPSRSPSLAAKSKNQAPELPWDWASCSVLTRCLYCKMYQLLSKRDRNRTQVFNECYHFSHKATALLKSLCSRVLSTFYCSTLSVVWLWPTCLMMRMKGFVWVRRWRRTW